MTIPRSSRQIAGAAGVVLAALLAASSSAAQPSWYEVIVERWRREYNTFRPHKSLGYRPPAPETVQWPWPMDEKVLLGLT